MKVVYLDQNHWIELSRAAHGRPSRSHAMTALEAFRKAQASRTACFPLSLAHYIETLKQQAPERRARLASFMLNLSGGVTVAPPHVVLRHEIEVALERLFPGRVVPRPFQFLGVSGREH